MIELLRCPEGQLDISPLPPRRTSKPWPARLAKPPLAIILPTFGDGEVSIAALAQLARLRAEIDPAGACFRIVCLRSATVQSTALRRLDLAQLPGWPMAEHAVTPRLIDQIIRAYRLDGDLPGPPDFAAVLLDGAMRHVSTIRSGDPLALWRSGLRLLAHAGSPAPAPDRHRRACPSSPETL